MNGQRRSMQDRRSGKDRRKFEFLKKWWSKGDRPRNPANRRTASERRAGWVRLTRWSSVYLKNLKIAKFLKSFD